MPERPRKTVHVVDLRKLVNDRLALPDEALVPHIIQEGMTPAQAFRTALSGLLESVLMESGNYQGFGYLERLNAHEPGAPIDETRRRYF